MSKEMIEQLQNAASETENPRLSLEAKAADRIEQLETECDQLREQVKMLQINLRSASNYIDLLGGNSKDYRQALAAKEPKE